MLVKPISKPLTKPAIMTKGDIVVPAVMLHIGLLTNSGLIYTAVTKNSLRYFVKSLKNIYTKDKKNWY